MAQLRETKCLTSGQIDTIISNWATVLKATSCTALFKGKPVFSLENIKQWHLPHITKFANNYVLYELKFKNEPNLYIITIETDKFDKVNIQACIWFYHYFDDIVYKTQNARPEVFICPCFVVTAAMFNHVPINILPCIYRFVPLPEIYPSLGSRNGPWAMTWEYRRLSEAEVQGTRSYSIMLDSDPVVKIINGIPGDTIEHKRVLCEGSPYAEYYRRTIQSTVTDINAIAPSGICYGVYQGKQTETKIEDDDESKSSKPTGEVDVKSLSKSEIKAMSKIMNEKEKVDLKIKHQFNEPTEPPKLKSRTSRPVPMSQRKVKFVDE